MAGRSSAAQAKPDLRIFVSDLNRLVGEALRRAGLLLSFGLGRCGVWLGKRQLGREACVKGYRQFIPNSKVRRSRESRFKVDVWDRGAGA